jgi:hypothetical protein
VPSTDAIPSRLLSYVSVNPFGTAAAVMPPTGVSPTSIVA